MLKGAGRPDRPAKKVTAEEVAAAEERQAAEHEALREELGAPKVVETSIGRLMVREVKLEEYLMLPAQLLYQLGKPETVATACIVAFYWLLEQKVARPVGEVTMPEGGLTLAHIPPAEVVEVVKASGLFLAATSGSYYEAFREAWGEGSKTQGAE